MDNGAFDWACTESMDEKDSMSGQDIDIMMSRRGDDHWMGYLSVLVYPSSQSLRNGQYFNDADSLTLRWVNVLSRTGEWYRKIKPLGH